MPFGIWAGDGVNGITIANLTIRDLYFHPIIFNAGAENPRVYNVHLIDAGEQFIKANPDDVGGGVDNGIVEYSVIEFTTTGRSDYPKGVDIQTAQNWIVRHNVFKNLVPPGGGSLSGPAVLAWRGTTNTTVEGNVFLNCTRSVMLGADDYYSPSHRGGVIRNNIVFRAANQVGDVGIMLTSSPDTQVLNNTVYLSGTYASPIEYRYGITSNVLIANNLVDGTIAARDDATATLRTNLQGAGPGYFTSVASGDLHLSAVAGGAIDQGTTLGAVTDDWDGEARPQGQAYDIGADERAASTVTYRVGGRVTDASGTPLSGVTLTLSGGQSRTATSDAAGAYVFTGLAGGPAYTVAPAKTGLAFTPANQYVAALAQDQNGTDFIAVALPSGSATAAFVRSDTSTAGTWMGTYGADGSAVAGGATAIPAYATVAISSASSWTWAASTGDARAPQTPSGDRVAACWYAGGSFTIDVNLTDGQSHQVALYLLDWDGWGRALRAEVVDAATGAVLDTRQASGFQSGQYLVWTLKGHVVLRLINAGPQNAVASALLFGAGGGGTTTPPSGATASFTRTDDTTGGNWNDAYGTDGYAHCGRDEQLPVVCAGCIRLGPELDLGVLDRRRARAATAVRLGSNRGDLVFVTAFTIDVNSHRWPFAPGRALPARFRSMGSVAACGCPRCGERRGARHAAGQRAPERAIPGVVLERARRAAPDQHRPAERRRQRTPVRRRRGDHAAGLRHERRVRQGRRHDERKLARSVWQQGLRAGH